MFFLNIIITNRALYNASFVIKIESEKLELILT